MIALGRRMMDLEAARRIVELFLSEPFDEGRHAPRIAQVDQPEPTD